MIVICLIAQVQPKNASAQSRLPQEITIGIRSLAGAIGKIKTSGNWGGFCPLLIEELTKELTKDNPNIIVNLPIIANEYEDRYAQLKENTIQIQCGPDTIISDRVILEEKDWEHIVFSNPFHTTGIKLLLKKEFAKSSEDEEGNISQDKLNNIKIGVIFDTTTYYQLKKRGYKIITFNTIEEVLNALEDGEQIQAYADDALILNTILESDYQHEGYTLYPQAKEKYLPETERENYGIAVSKESGYSQLLLEKINQTLELASIQEYRKKLKTQEVGKTRQQLLEEKDRYITNLLQKFKKEKDTNKKLTIVVVILAIVTILSTSFLGYTIFQKSR